MSQKKIKILQLVSSIDIGGAENVAFSISEYCNSERLNYEFILAEIYHSKNDYASNKRRELGQKQIRIKTLFKGSKRLSLIFSPFTLLSFLVKEKPEIIHSHTDIPDFVLSITLRFLKVLKITRPKIIRTIHNTELWPTHKKIGKYTEKSFIDDTIIGVSEVSLNAYHNIRINNHLPVSTDQHLIYNGCKNPIQSPLNIQLNHDKINIAFCGRFEYQKGIDVLIQRLNAINSGIQSAIDFYFIGSGHYQTQLITLTNSFSNIHLYAPIDNIADKLHAFDFLIMPSRFEGLVLISIEASLAKVPVIAAKAPGLTETLPKDWPLLFSLDDENSLTEILTKITMDFYNLNELKEQSYKYVNHQFSFEKMINKYSEVFSSQCKL